jgi:hypothetical protein
VNLRARSKRYLFERKSNGREIKDGWSFTAAWYWKLY